MIEVETVLSANISSIYAGRLNAAAQGSTSTTVATTVSTWTTSMTMTFTVSFNDQDSARYFFNAGGQLGLSFSHPGSDFINNAFNLIASRFGTVWLSSPTSGSISLSSISYQGVTQIGGTTSGSNINSNLGFYALTSVNQQIAEKYESSAYFSDSFITINARSNGVGVITFTVLWDEVPDAVGTVTAGSTGTLTVKPPSTSFLADTWGTPAVTTAISSL